MIKPQRIHHRSWGLSPSAKPFVDHTVEDDTECEVEELITLMENRGERKKRVLEARPGKVGKLKIIQVEAPLSMKCAILVDKIVT